MMTAPTPTSTRSWTNRGPNTTLIQHCSTQVTLVSSGDVLVRIFFAAALRRGARRGQVAAATRQFPPQKPTCTEVSA